MSAAVNPDARRQEKALWRHFSEGVRHFRLIGEGDHILLGLSGGKDSLALLALLGQAARRSGGRWRVTALHVRIDSVRYESDTAYLEARAAAAGVPLLVETIHVEADTSENTRKALEIIQGCGVTPAISIKPKTPAESVLPFLDLCGLILVMTVEPGFGGQSFMADLMPKLQTVRSYIDEKNPTCELEVDGGINPETAKVCIAHGANVLVAGSAYFKSADKAAFVRSIKE